LTAAVGLDMCTRKLTAVTLDYWDIYCSYGTGDILKQFFLY